MKATRYLMRFPTEYMCELLNAARHSAFGLQAAKLVLESSTWNSSPKVLQSENQFILISRCAALHHRTTSISLLKYFVNCRLALIEPNLTLNGLYGLTTNRMYLGLFSACM
jgi:hypothetical protein